MSVISKEKIKYALHNSIVSLIMSLHSCFASLK